AAKSGSMRTRISSPDGRTKATTQPMRQPSTPASQISDDIELSDRAALCHPLIAEQREIERDEAAMGDQLGDRAPGGGRLLQTVTRETVGENEVADLRMPPDHGALVQRIVVVVTGPGALQLERLHGGHPMRQGRPHGVVELVVV